MMEEIYQAIALPNKVYTIEAWAVKKGDTCKTLTQVEKAWLACAIDSEGSVLCHKTQNALGYRLAIVVYNTNKEFVEWAYKCAGCGTLRVHNPGEKAKSFSKTPMHIWHLSKQSICVNMLEQLIPFLIIKRTKAEAAV